MELWNLSWMFFISQMGMSLLCDESMDDIEDDVPIMFVTLLYMQFIEESIHRKYEFTTYPTLGRSNYPAGIEDSFWCGKGHLFQLRFRFRQEDLVHIVQAMKLKDKLILCGRKDHHQYYRADLCLMVVLRRLSYPNRFRELSEEFGLSSPRLCEIFHATIEYISAKYSKITDLETWVPFFPEFADIMQQYGSPYDADLVDRGFNALMSRIRIHIENAFGNSSNNFAFHALGHPCPGT